MPTTPPPPPPTLTDLARRWTADLTSTLGHLFVRLGISADLLTALGLIGNGVAGWLAALGQMQWAGLVLLLLAPLDALDGATARAAGTASPWGAFFDSTVDRFAEAAVWLGLMWYFVQQPDATGRSVYAALCFAAFVGSVMVSYTRARAEGLGVSVKVGLLTRLERYLVIVPALLLGWPQVAAWLVAVLANLTALQRMAWVHSQLNQRRDD